MSGFLLLFNLIAIQVSSIADHSERILYRSLERSQILGNLRVSFQILPGYFNVPHYTELNYRVAPAVAEFFGSALKTYSVSGLLKPSVLTCEDITVPEDDLKIGFEADVIIYLHSNETVEWPAYGKFCEREGSTFKRPIVGHVSINPNIFFSLYENMQIQYLIRETAHVLALDFDLFKDFVHSDGSKYSSSQYSIFINYPIRGKTVRALAFPQMLLRARLAFNCDLQGLETEDYFYEDLTGKNLFFWDGRVMPQDIMVSELLTDTIFSDITLALIEDSGWYSVNYDYSQNIKWGFGAGFAWHDTKCINSDYAALPGFCDTSTEPNQCDALGLGYGECYIQVHENIPLHEVYFQNISLGGKEYIDYCPTIEVTSINRCRDSTKQANELIGEKKGRKSRCFTSTLTKPSQSPRKPQGACYELQTCTEEFAVIIVQNNVIDCLYNTKVSVEGFSGLLNCPPNYEFCLNLPCPNMCSGKGKCIHGTCYCNAGSGGEDCSFKCDKSCKTCTSISQCKDCNDGFFLSNYQCLPCNSMCKTCKLSESSCTSCKDKDELIGDKCKEFCIEHCASCDIPCSKCDSGYFLSDSKCEKCDQNCKECSENSKKCTSCNPNFTLSLGTCNPTCLEGCVSCEYPCKSCKPSYLLLSDKCELCDNLCKECYLTTSTCKSCYSGFTLKDSTCTQLCKPNCLTCDDPCTTCENQFYLNQGQCLPCGPNCFNCLSPTVCSSCKPGFQLKGASCEKECTENCETCVFPCSKCFAGYLLEYGKCSKCSENCRTCQYFIDHCLSCHDGFGLVNNNCVKNCADHCVSCDSPCKECEIAYYKSKGSCFKCHEACYSCTGPGPDNCLSCNQGYVKSGTTCQLPCQEHCNSCDEPCSSCEPGFFNFQLGCAKCNSICLTCKTVNQCESCKEGFGLVDKSCRQGCIDHCLACDNPCTLCESGYYINQGVCRKCSSDCQNCENTSKTCTSCPTGFKLLENECKPSCINNCLSCQYPCLSCAPNFISIEGFCHSCPIGCGTCSSDLRKCYSCTAGYILNSNICEKLCSPYCKSCDDPCTECESGYISVNGICLPCQHPCRSCLDTQSTCTSCVYQFKLTGNQCKSECLEHCKTCTNPCTECIEGFTLVGNTCKICESNCRTCLNSPSQCTSCGLYMKLSEGKCISSCVENCEDCSYPCSKCKKNFELIENLCVECQEYLNESEIEAEFIKDFTGISINFAVPVKVRENDCNKVFKIQTIAMLGSEPLCSWVSDSNFMVAFGDKQDLNIRTLEMFPLSGYGHSCSNVKTELAVKIELKDLRKPLISLSAPEKFTIGCENQVLVIQGYTKEDIYEFELTTKPALPIKDNFFDYLSGKIIVIPESQLRECQITVTFSATNLFGMTSKVEKIIHVTKIQQFSLSIDAGSRLELTTYQSFTIRGMLSETSCAHYENLSFKWEYVKTDTNSLNNADHIISQSGLQNMLRISKGSLSPGNEYLFRFNVSDQNINEFSEITISIIHGPLYVQLDKSDCSHSVNEDFELTAKVPYYADSKEYDIKYEWSCIEDSKTCTDSYGKRLLSNETTNSLKVEKYQMKLNKKYYFTVKVSNGFKIASNSILVSTHLPYGSIEIPTIYESVNIQEDLYVNPSFFNVDKNTQFNWIQLNGPAVKPASKPQSSYLIIKKNEMVSGRMYEFQVMGRLNNESISSNLRWVTNTGPNCGLYTTKVVENTVTIFVDCQDGDHNDYPLLYIYGVKHNKNYMPLRVVHSPSTTFKLNSGEWVVYTDICDSLKTCIRKQNTISIQNKSEFAEKKNQYDFQKLLPESLPLAILNSKGEFHLRNFEKTLKELENYIEVQEIDLVHLKMSIECLEILTESNKTQIMKEYQNEIVDFLVKIVKKIQVIDDDAMNYVVDLFSKHEVVSIDSVSLLMAEFSARWVKKMPPGESRLIVNDISLLRHRFIGQDTHELYQFSSVNISNLFLKGSPNTIYDLLIIIYPSSPAPVVFISYFEIGSYISFNTQLYSKLKQLTPDLLKPFFIDYYSLNSKDIACQQLRGDYWIDEGCKIEKLSKSVTRLSSWHISTYKISKTNNTQIGYSAIVTESIMLILSICFVTLFCVVDRSKYSLIPQYAEFHGINSPRGNEEEKNEYEIVDGEKVSIERKNPVRATFDELRVPVVHILVYHPTFNVCKQQNGERRAASVLHLSAVMFSEFAVVGGMYNPYLHSVFDSEGKFNGFSNEQIFVFVFGMVAVQVFSVALMFLNQVDDSTITKRYIGVGISTFLIAANSVISIILAVSYPSNYSLYWVLSFFCCLALDLSLFQSIYWALNVKVFKRDLALTRNIRVFTSDS